MKKIFIVTVILTSIIINSNVFSQKSKKANPVQSETKFTDYDFYEKLRVGRKEKKIKLIKTFQYANDALFTIDSFDIDGYLRKREFYYTVFETGEVKLVTQIIVTDYNSTGAISGIYQSSSALEGESKFEFKNLSLKNFYETDAFEGEQSTDSVNFVFDNGNNLIEIKIYGEHLVGTGKKYESKYFYYDSNGKLTESRSSTRENSVSITKYFYDEKGLLEREATSYDFQNDSRDYGMRYECEYYFTENNPSAKIINVSAYEYQTTLECIEDYIESNPNEYEGLYTFVHFGTDGYTFFMKNNEISIVWDFESLTYKENSSYTNIRFDKNWVYATESNGREFKARFVKLKCDINSEIMKGFIGLLVNEENLYLMQGD